MQKTISVIIPAYNEEKNIPLIGAEILDVFSSLPYEYEIIFVNDGSEDASQKAIEGLVESNNKIKSIEFSRNFGKEAATSAGLHNCCGDAAILIDAKKEPKENGSNARTKVRVLFQHESKPRSKPN